MRENIMMWITYFGVQTIAVSFLWAIYKAILFFIDGDKHPTLCSIALIILGIIAVPVGLCCLPVVALFYFYGKYRFKQGRENCQRESWEYEDSLKKTWEESGYKKGYKEGWDNCKTVVWEREDG